MAWIHSAEAIRLLGVRPQTLYAYVSRGRLEARPDPDDPRRSLYSAEDVERLAASRSGPKRTAEIARATIAWGEPVLTSKLTVIANGRPCYRGVDAIALSQAATLESAAAHFWAADYAPRSDPQPAEHGPLKARLFMALARRAGAAPHARGRARAMLAVDAATVVETLVDAACDGRGEGPAHVRLGEAWGLDADGADMVRRALVLLLDHELNASTFSARVAASTGASLPACALAGLSTLSGPLHGGAVTGVGTFLLEAAALGAAGAVRARLDEGRALPGFGHPLYPDGDPRAAELLARFTPSGPATALQAAVAAETGEQPNVDLAIGAMAQRFSLPDDAAFAVFAIGRSIGWLGHAMEQIETGSLIRPRARYVGPLPSAAGAP
ncbi:citrate synthase family protein [Hyphomonas johnsonii]|uniref:citrate synthase (unknown stereospecificity) n=1 Tax=Hyphomonas johnsonii MHS-2 TaxID=1280950 RepID=A0A059FP39_9PROT|nr:citrate synthase family protein [Hyphomonas johnsonii]KCZ92430.1 citrate synthase [Hyphomonas johnsonii MHS-2]